MPGQMDYEEHVQVTARAKFTFPTDEEHRIIGRASYRNGYPDLVLVSIAISKGSAGQSGPAEMWRSPTVKGRLILKSGALGADLVDVAYRAGSYGPDDDRVERIRDIVEQCYAEFDAAATTPRDIIARTAS
jgi:hypothetical protein